ncbi:MAG: NCS2 family permease [Bacteroides sp.]|nr:NCS2 family permease [Prevotella sp.]MCM1407679.1 NCS2 family permease [Treponema brennaborense]MCM1469171.1 NCS2 family permease [Bacteroides sp.]
MEKFFKVKENGSAVKTEILAGLTTFMAMAYILMVNAGMFSELGTVSYNAIYIATAISAVIGTVLIGVLANLPLGMASGMGLNAFFVYTVCFGFGLTYANALVLVLLDGIVFIILTLTGLREKIFEAIPNQVRIAIPAGIGLFIAFIGLQNAGIVVSDSATCVNLVSLNVFSGSATWASVMPVLVTIGSVIAIAVMTKKGMRGAVLWGIIGGAAAYYVLGCTVPDFYKGFSSKLNFNPFTAFEEFAAQAFGKVFTEGFDFSAYLANHSSADLIILIITTALAFCLVDMFDTLGTLYGACARGNLLTKDGKVPSMNKAMLADAIATTCGAVCGTSTVTTYVESSAGVAEGGKTGLSAMVTGALFFIAMFFSPIAALVPGCATAAALVYVGVLMMNCVRDIDWLDAETAVPAFLTAAMMPMTYNISYGIAFGVISYIFIKLFSGKIKEIKAGTFAIGILFAVMFFVTH